MYLSRFKTQKEAKEYVRELYATTQMGRITDPEFERILSFHPNYEKKVGCGIDHLEMSFNEYRQKVVYICRVDQTVDTFSWVACITRPSPEKLYKYSLNSALRQAIQDQISEFRHTHEWTCPCGYQGENFHVDHINQFKQLADEFLKKHEPPKQFGKCLLTQNSILEDIPFRKAWQQYHRENAHLRILCKTCNLTRKKNG